MTCIPLDEFDRLYQEVVDEIMRHWTRQMQDEVARHNRGWAADKYDFHLYLRSSARRYYFAYCDLLSDGPDKNRFCDIGGLFGVFPIAMSRLGYEVTMTEALKYYGVAFDKLFERVSDSGVRIIDLDLFERKIDFAERFDAISVMAVLEHYPHSLRLFMQNVKSILSPIGKLYVEVPSITYFRKRIGLLQGETPLPAFADVYNSEVPFIGHHREFSTADLRELASLAGFTISNERRFNYSIPDASSTQLVRFPLMTLANWLFPSTRECLSALCTPKP